MKYDYRKLTMLDIDNVGRSLLWIGWSRKWHLKKQPQSWILKEEEDVIMPKTGKGDILKQTNECRGFAEEELKVV